MPLYEYECLTCRKHTEKIQKFSDPEITLCPHCGGELKRVISAPAFSLKGGGWYADGYGSAKPPGGTGDKSDVGDKPAGDKSAAPAPSTDSPAPASAPAAAPAPSAPAPAASSSEKS